MEKCTNSLLDELERTKEQNKLVNKEFGDNFAKYTAMKQKIDQKMKGVLSSVEASWLSRGRFLLTGYIEGVYIMLLIVYIFIHI